MPQRHPLLRGPATGRNVSLPEELDKALEAQAIREDRPISRIVRRALLEYLERQSPLPQHEIQPQPVPQHEIQPQPA